MKEALRANLYRAKEGFAALRRSFPETTFIAPWIAAVLSGADDRDPAQRDAGLVDDCAVVERCDGIVLWGARLSDGMRREMEHGVRARHGFEVFDLTGDRGHLDAQGLTFQQWYAGVVSVQR